MKKKIIAIGISILIIALAFFAVKMFPARSTNNKTTPTVKAVLVDATYPEAGNAGYQTSSTGKITATERFEIFSQVDGQLLELAKLFKEGKTYRKGDVMLAVDAEEFKMTLLAQKSNFITLITSTLPDLKSDYPQAYNKWKNYVMEVDINQRLPAMPVANDAQEKFYLSGKGIYSNFYNIQSLEEKFEKYTILAPYNGIVTLSKVESGQAVRPGTQMGVFINPTKYDLEITMPLGATSDIKVGTMATLTSSEIQGKWSGEVIRIGGNIDELSQSVKIFIRTAGENLKEGMFLTAHIQLAPFENAISLPRKMINDNNEVFTIENGKLKLQKVEVLIRQGDMAIVKGLSADTPILSTVIKNAYDGMPVTVISNQ